MPGLLRSALTLLGLFTLITGAVYPLLVTGLAQALFPVQANGSRIYRSGEIIGSSLIGQAFQDDRYFWGRPSATSPGPYNAGASTGSNLGPSNRNLHDAVQQRVAALVAAAPQSNAMPVPVDLVTSSGSGLDPHISPAAALYQVGRVVRTRNLPVAQVRGLVERHLEGRTLSVLGEPRVNVLELNVGLDELAQTGAFR